MSVEKNSAGPRSFQQTWTIKASSPHYSVNCLGGEILQFLVILGPIEKRPVCLFSTILGMLGPNERQMLFFFTLLSALNYKLFHALMSYVSNI